MTVTNKITKREIKFRALYEGVWYYQTLEEMLTITLAAFRNGEHKTQYTGLKDKNGKEIYEGDIVSIPLYGNVIIIWNEDICAFQYAYHAIRKGTAVGGRMTNTLYKHKSEVDYEVIGNIYENENFLK